MPLCKIWTEEMTHKGTQSATPSTGTWPSPQGSMRTPSVRKEAPGLGCVRLAPHSGHQDSQREGALKARRGLDGGSGTPHSPTETANKGKGLGKTKNRSQVRGAAPLETRKCHAQNQNVPCTPGQPRLNAPTCPASGRHSERQGLAPTSRSRADIPAGDRRRGSQAHRPEG